MRKYRRLFAALVASLGLATPAAAQINDPSDPTVTLHQLATSRTVSVEDMASRPLTSLAFGTSRTLPFKVRVVDSNYPSQGFTVNATMTNLYRDQGDLVADYSLAPIMATQVSLGRQVNTPEIASVTVDVQPLVDVAVTLTGADLAICQTLLDLNALPADCNLSALDVPGITQDGLAITVNLADLGALPLVPSSNETGNFTAPEYDAGYGLGDTARGASAPDADAQVLLAGSPGVLSDVLRSVDAQLSALTRAQVVTGDAILDALESQFPDTFALLTPLQLDAIVAGATVSDVSIGSLSDLGGSYTSLPTLNVDDTGAPGGDYVGTLVVTAVG